jgi:hypothetical protein
MSITGGITDTNTDYFISPSFSVSTQNMTGGAFSAGSPLYSFLIPAQGGYDLNGNLLTVNDSVMGQWSYSHDNLNPANRGSRAYFSADRRKRVLRGSAKHLGHMTLLGIV